MLASKIKTSTNWTHAILILAVSLVLTHWVVDAVLPQNLLWQIKHPLSIGALETRFLYL
ncbi:MAG: hypothetical protein HC817_06740, partial [Saprospiraceae bacterium]|nr:hypothetical protein [Saprospiraceae bacterium]